MTDYPFNADKPVKADTITNFCTYTEQNDEHIFRSLFGFLRRPKFRWKDTDEIYIGPGCYHHYGSTRNRLVWWNSELTYAFGSGGSNAHSDDLGNDQWHYLFIYDDHVNVLASNELTATCFSNDTTAPTWSDTYHGWYTGNNRCIGAFLTGGTANILEFFHNGNEYIQYADQITEYSGGTPSTTWTDVDCVTSIPSFSIEANLTFFASYVDAGAATYYRVNGQSGTVAHRVASVGTAGTYSTNSIRVHLSTAQVIEVKFDAATANTLYVYTNGYYLPVGM